MEFEWESKWPGRLQLELEALEAAGAIVAINDEESRKGSLTLDIDWPLSEGRIALQAIYPEGFPFIRPLVSTKERPGGRHIHPLSRGVCLLGRGTHNWSSAFSLAEVLSTQLEAALAASAEPESETASAHEERDGIPAEEWWNCFDQFGSYVLVDSNWSVDQNCTHGKLILRHHTEFPSGRTRGFIEQVQDGSGNILTKWDGPVGQAFTSATQIRIPWVRLPETLIPSSNVDLTALINSYPFLSKHTPQPISGTKFKIGFYCFVYPTELQWREFRDGWLILAVIFPPGSKGAVPRVIRTFRAGLQDFAVRIPDFLNLIDKKIVIFGLGALGSPLAVEIARNGCGELRLVEPDIVEPGNTVRWALGQGSWSVPKALALKSFIEHEFPWASVTAIPQRIGDIPFPGVKEEWRSMDKILDGADLVIDTTAEVGINRLLDNFCFDRELQLITAHASPTLGGGVVARFSQGKGDGCRYCAENAWASHELPEPPGSDHPDHLLRQVPGCAERTFVGANYDLSEIALQAARLAIDTLRTDHQYEIGSCLQVLRLINEDGRRIPPSWQSLSLRIHKACSAHHR